MQMSRRGSARWLFVVLIASGLGPTRLHADWFIRGDTNSSGAVNVSDAIDLLRHLFSGAPAPSCADAADANDDGKLDVADAIYLLGYLFLNKAAPVSPIAGCWYDQTLDALPCERSPACGSLGIFFVTQKSGLFAQSLPRAKAEMVRIIERLGERDQIAMAFFDGHLKKFPASGAPAQLTPEMKAAALAYLRSEQSGSGTCAQPAATAALTAANQSTATRIQLVYFANGYNTCPGHEPTEYSNEILADIQARNINHFPIHAFCIGRRDGVDEAWMKKLASQNSGSFVRIIP